MRPLIFLVLSRYRLACKHRIIFEISIYNWIWAIPTCCDKSDGLSRDELRVVYWLR